MICSANDLRYLAKLADWAAGQGFCHIDGLDEDPDVFVAGLWDRLGESSDDYSADNLAEAVADTATLIDELQDALRDAVAYTAPRLSMNKPVLYFEEVMEKADAALARATPSTNPADRGEG